MAKKRVNIGSIAKTKDGKGQYLKVASDLTLKLKKGQYINMDSPKKQLEGVKKAFEEGKMSEETFEKAVERINKIPDWVLADVYVLVDE